MYVSDVYIVVYLLNIRIGLQCMYESDIYLFALNIGIFLHCMYVLDIYVA